jgi:hypothetical protein
MAMFTVRDLYGDPPMLPVDRLFPGWRQAAIERLDDFCGLHPPPPGFTINRATNPWWNNKGADSMQKTNVDFSSTKEFEPAIDALDAAHLRLDVFKTVFASVPAEEDIKPSEIVGAADIYADFVLGESGADCRDDLIEDLEECLATRNARIADLEVQVERLKADGRDLLVRNTTQRAMIESRDAQIGNMHYIMDKKNGTINAASGLFLAAHRVVNPGHNHHSQREAVEALVAAAGAYVAKVNTSDATSSADAVAKALSSVRAEPIASAANTLAEHVAEAYRQYGGDRGATVGGGAKAADSAYGERRHHIVNGRVVP